MHVNTEHCKRFMKVHLPFAWLSQAFSIVLKRITSHMNQTYQNSIQLFRDFHHEVIFHNDMSIMRYSHPPYQQYLLLYLPSQITSSTTTNTIYSTPHLTKSHEKLILKFRLQTITHHPHLNNGSRDFRILAIK